MRAIRVHDWDHVAAALNASRAAARPVMLLSPVALAAGIGWWRALMARARTEFPDLDFAALLDCGPSAGLALAALRNGAGPVAVAAPPRVRQRLSDIAAQAGRQVMPAPAAVLDLLLEPSPLLACGEWLAGDGPTPPPAQEQTGISNVWIEQSNTKG